MTLQEYRDGIRARAEQSEAFKHEVTRLQDFFMAPAERFPITVEIYQHAVEVFEKRKDEIVEEMILDSWEDFTALIEVGVLEPIDDLDELFKIFMQSFKMSNDVALQNLAKLTRH